MKLDVGLSLHIAVWIEPISSLSIATKKQPKSQGGWQIINNLSTTLLTPFGTSNSLLGNSMRCPTRHAFESKLQRSHPAEMADS